MYFIQIITLVFKYFVFTFSFAQNSDIQEKLFQTMNAHQEQKISDEVFTQRVKELKSTAEWGRNQNEFLQDYASQLPEGKATSFDVPDNRDLENYKTLDLPTNRIDEAIASSEKTKWPLWATLGVVGAAILLSPYKIVIGF